MDNDTGSVTGLRWATADQSNNGTEKRELAERRIMFVNADWVRTVVNKLWETIAIKL